MIASIRAILLILLLATATSAQGVSDAERAKLAATRDLVGSDIEKYCLITAGIRNGTRGLSPSRDGQRFAQVSANAAREQGWLPIEYSVIDARIKAALMHLDMEKRVPIPADKKAICELVRRHRTEITAARK